MGEIAAIHEPNAETIKSTFRGKPYFIIRVQGQTLVLDDPVWCDILEDSVAQAREFLA